MRTVCVSVVAFSVDFSQLLSQSCTSAVCPRSFLCAWSLFLSVYVDDIEMTGKRQNKAPMWKKLMNIVDLEEPTSFLDHANWGCGQRTRPARARRFGVNRVETPGPDPKNRATSQR